MPEADYHHHVDTIIGAGVHVVLARQSPDTSREGAINDSERLFLMASGVRESWRSAVWGLFVGTLLQNSAKLRALLHTPSHDGILATA